MTITNEQLWRALGLHRPPHDPERRLTDEQLLLCVESRSEILQDVVAQHERAEKVIEERRLTASTDEEEHWLRRLCAVLGGYEDAFDAQEAAEREVDRIMEAAERRLRVIPGGRE